MRDLSIIVPAREEVFLSKTIENVLENIRADTEIIAVVDGYSCGPLPESDRLVVIRNETPQGQRASTNIGVRASTARFCAKLDAHCAVDEGFDVKLMEDCQPDWTMVSAMHNLHAFDWVCMDCLTRTYQGSKPQKCAKCEGTAFSMEMAWKPRPNRMTVSWRFDNNLQFQYWKSHSKRPECKQPLIETMSCIGCFFFMERERFWELGGMDEGHGSWGQYGTELACKAWLSGGKLMCSKKTWIAHMFRTGNFAGNGQSTWPYPISQQQIDRAREYSRDLWLNNRWPGQKYPLSWLVERFAPVDGWPEDDLRALKDKEVKDGCPQLR